MTHIYALVSGQLILYVGKTNQTLKQRESKHRSRDNSHSRYIPEYIDWIMKLLEIVPDDQGTVKEQHYYDTLKPLYNKCRPGQTFKEYQQTEAYKNSEAIKESCKQYQQSEACKKKNREASRKYRLKKKSKTPVDETLVY